MAAPSSKPLIQDFFGVCGHTIQFKADLYKPVCRLVRDYHDFGWDVGQESDFVTTFPFARNRVDWSQVYGSWKQAGFITDVSLMFPHIQTNQWKDLPRDATAYGRAFAAYFGPSSGRALVESAEIGNEPGHYSDPDYRLLFESMAKGMRSGDPKLKILTCALTAGKSHRYAKSVECVAGLTHLFDVLTVHTYAEAEPWPTWRRSFPEDPKIKYLREVEELLSWRDKNAPGKPVWITEFGWDSSTKPAPATGDFAKWIGNTDEQQAQYLVRSVLLFSKMPVDRAYIYFFNDNDQPQVHGAAGLTRNYVPKPSYYALAHLQQVLGTYRFNRVVMEKEIYVYEFVHGTHPREVIWVAWSPTGEGKKGRVTLPLQGKRLRRVESMPLAKEPAATALWKENQGRVTLEISEAPLYLSLE